MNGTKINEEIVHPPSLEAQKQRILKRHAHRPVQRSVTTSHSDYRLPSYEVKIVDSSYSVECVYTKSEATVEKSTQTEQTCFGVVRRDKPIFVKTTDRPLSCIVTGSRRMVSPNRSRRSFPRGTVSNASSHSDVFLFFHDSADETDSSSLSSP